MSKVLDVRNLTVDYLGQPPRRLVDGLSFSLERGKTLAIVGESGAGKSMTSLGVLDLLPDNVRRTGGSVFVDGQDIASLSQDKLRALRGGKAAMIMQNPMSAFDPVFNVRSHFAETLAAHEGGLGKTQVTERAMAALALAGFDDPGSLLDVYPFQMSGGMLQRVMIALALCGSPKLLIADEATTDLDVVSQKQIVELLQKRKAELGLSLLLITHDLSVAASLADDVLVMHQGRLVEKAPAAQIFSSPSDDYTRRLMQAHFKLYSGRFETLLNGETCANTDDTLHAAPLTAIGSTGGAKRDYAQCKEFEPTGGSHAPA